MTLHPTELQLINPEQLRIAWSDTRVDTLAVRQLHKQCPCASCREQRNASPPKDDPLAILKPEETQPLGIVSMRPVGNYAYGIQFSDGHDTGIFTLEFLRQLGKGE